MSRNGAGFDPDIEDVYPRDHSDDQIPRVRKSKLVTIHMDDEKIFVPTRQELGMRKTPMQTYMPLMAYVNAAIIVVAAILIINFMGYVLDIPGGLFN